MGCRLTIFILLAAHARVSHSWWRPSGWVPRPPGPDLVLSDKTCSRQFVESALTGIQHFRQACGEKDANAAHHSGFTEEKCFMHCYYVHTGLPFDDNFLLPRVMDTGYFLQGVAYSFNSSSNICECYGLVPSPTGPPTYWDCATFTSVVPLTCMWVPEELCLQAPPDACRWDNGCCVDAYAKGQGNGSTYLASIMLVITVGIIVLTSAFIVWCIRNIRHITYRRRSERAASNAPYGNGPEALDYTSIVIALNTVETVAAPIDSCCVVCLEGGNIPSDATAIPEHSNLENLCELLHSGQVKKIHVKGWCSLQCAHVLHKYCLERWFLEQARKRSPPSCPICRAAVDLRHEVHTAQEAPPADEVAVVVSTPEGDKDKDKSRDTADNVSTPDAEPPTGDS